MLVVPYQGSSLCDLVLPKMASYIQAMICSVSSIALCQPKRPTILYTIEELWVRIKVPIIDPLPRFGHKGSPRLELKGHANS